MVIDVSQTAERPRHLAQLTRDWGEWDAVSLYLDRCQVDTPANLVAATWRHVEQVRENVGKVLDFGAGDGRFSHYGRYSEYIGYEIDTLRCVGAALPDHARLVNRCAFSDEVDDADVCIGNPPFVRNQDLPVGWRQSASEILKRRTCVTVSGLANAWQYFFLLSLVSCRDDGICALIIPYEWVSRPSTKSLRNYVIAQKWNVSVYRLVDTTFASVLTTSSITIIDKARHEGRWDYFEETASGAFAPLSSASGSSKGVIRYLRRIEVAETAPRAIRGLSPGTQKVLTLTEGERVRFGLNVDRDVVPCVTTLRPTPTGCSELDSAAFKALYRDAGQKCWLIRTDGSPSRRLGDYLDAVPETDYQTSTCLEREVWWKFKMPPVPALLMAQSFKGKFPKALKNTIKARAVGGVCGVYNLDKEQSEKVTTGLNGLDLRDRVVAHSQGLRKIEINQLNTLLAEAFGAAKAG
jgi:hypothetical protein